MGTKNGDRETRNVPEMHSPAEKNVDHMKETIDSLKHEC